MEIEGTSGSLCVKASSVWSDERPDMGGGGVETVDTLLNSLFAIK